MLLAVKFLHFLGLMLGAGAGFGTMVVARHIRRSAGVPTPQLAALRPAFGMMGLVGILLIWASGLWLYLVAYQSAPLGAAFHAKLAVATLLLLVIVAINLVAMRARRRGTPPPPWLPLLGMTTPVLTLLAVALAVVVFN